MKVPTLHRTDGVDFAVEYQEVTNLRAQRNRSHAASHVNTNPDEIATMLRDDTQRSIENQKVLDEQGIFDTATDSFSWAPRTWD